MGIVGLGSRAIYSVSGWGKSVDWRAPEQRVRSSKEYRRARSARKEGVGRCWRCRLVKHPCWLWATRCSQPVLMCWQSCWRRRMEETHGEAPATTSSAEPVGDDSNGIEPVSEPCTPRAASEPISRDPTPPTTASVIQLNRSINVSGLVAMTARSGGDLTPPPPATSTPEQNNDVRIKTEAAAAAAAIAAAEDAAAANSVTAANYEYEENTTGGNLYLVQSTQHPDNHYEQPVG